MLQVTFTTPGKNFTWSVVRQSVCTMNQNQLPESLFLYIPTRTGAKSLIRMSAKYQATAPGPSYWKLTPTEFNPDISYTVTMPATPSAGEHLATLVINNCDGICLNKRIKRHNDITIAHTVDNVGYIEPVFSMAQHTTVFGSHALKANAHLVFQHAPMTTMAPPPPAAAVPHTTPPVKKKRYIPGTTVSPYPSVSAFVAKQLLELAVMRKEMCPITIEEFSVGNTAVMPCGHLFMQIAIDESFKKEPHKCPWCRQYGNPTYV